MKPKKLLLPVLLLLMVPVIWNPAPPSENPPRKHLIEIGAMKFEPAGLQVRAGDTVVFVNRDFVVHNVTEAGKEWASPNLPPKACWSRVISKNISYYCSLHPMMKGKIVVKK